MTNANYIKNFEVTEYVNEHGQRVRKGRKVRKPKQSDWK